MISPNIVSLFIRHLDAIDLAVSRRMTRKRPWSEPALTSLLCDLLDEETQSEEDLRYPLGQLNQDLKSADGYLSFSFEVETREYDARMERWVTQADLGLVVVFYDDYFPENSWSTSWLLQAKRLYPNSRSYGPPSRYDETSRFGAIDREQSERIARLMNVTQVPFVRYLLYCPRPEFLAEHVRHKLAHTRNMSLSGQIFDYTLGLQLHSELGSLNSSLAAGLFVCTTEALPENLGGVHSSILKGNLPFSWFVVEHLVSRGRGYRFSPYPPPAVPLPAPTQGPKRRPSSARDDTAEERERWVEGIVKGKAEAIERLLSRLEEGGEQSFPILPRHTLTIRVDIGITGENRG